MITIQDLEVFKVQIQELTEPVKNDFKEIEKKYNARVKELQAPFYEMLEKYYDQLLLDTNGNTVKVGDILSQDNKVFFKVKSRGMQFLFGSMLDNSSVTCVRITKEGNMSKRPTEVQFHPRDLKYLFITKLPDLQISKNEKT